VSKTSGTSRRYGDRLNSEKLVQVGTFRSSVYKQLNGLHAVRPFWCGHLKDIHAEGRLDPVIAAQCAVIHPELLNRGDDK
jgi:hypothetical protein